MEHPEGNNKSIKISNLEVDSIVKKIMAISIGEIDELWFKTGWIDDEAEKDNRKALPNRKLNEIKTNKDFAEKSFINLITDDPYQELRTAAVFLNNLGKFTRI